MHKWASFCTLRLQICIYKSSASRQKNLTMQSIDWHLNPFVSQPTYIMVCNNNTSFTDVAQFLFARQHNELAVTVERHTHPIHYWSLRAQLEVCRVRERCIIRPYVHSVPITVAQSHPRVSEALIPGGIQTVCSVEWKGISSHKYS